MLENQVAEGEKRANALTAMTKVRVFKVDESTGGTSLGRGES